MLSCSDNPFLKSAITSYWSLVRSLSVNEEYSSFTFLGYPQSFTESAYVTYPEFSYAFKIVFVNSPLKNYRIDISWGEQKSSLHLNYVFKSFQIET